MAEETKSQISTGACERCGYHEAKYRERWNKVLCSQCNYDYDSPSQEELDGRLGTDF